MDPRRQYILQQMGITLWQSRDARPSGQQATKTLPEHCQILLVNESNPAPHGRFVRQVLKTMGLEHTQSHWLKPDELVEYQSLPELIWLQGELPETRDWLTQNTDGTLLVSSDLELLQQDVKAKRSLWQQICKAELSRVD